MKLLLATSNPGKIKEYQSLLNDPIFEMVTLAKLGLSGGPEEGEVSFAENAKLKSNYWAEKTGFLTLADDSGLEVNALGGAPGVISARYGGLALDDKERVDFLLRQMIDIPWEERQARFVCVIALALPCGSTYLFDGDCEGFIAFEPRGVDGFGYDPVFYLPELAKRLLNCLLSLRTFTVIEARRPEKPRNS